MMTDETTRPKAPPANSSFLLASRNTSLALQRTRLAADRTLMAVIRTALSLISFGFTIFKLAESLQEEKILKFHENAIPHFGITLVLLGIIMLGIGIVYHVQFMIGLRTSRKELIGDALIHGKNPFPISFILVTAFILLALGLTAISSMIFGIGPFS
jgi:putative membrane protein